MALWFLGCLGRGALDWWKGEVLTDLSHGAFASALLAIQLLSQNRIVGLVSRWRTPNWLHFLAVATFVTGIGVVLLFGISAVPSSWSEVASWDFPKLSTVWDVLLEEVFPVLGLFLAPWYAAWCIVVRLGWLRLPGSLIAAGIQLAVTPWLITFHRVPWEWVCLTPFQFFTGWSLLFLPGAVASCNAAVPQGRVSFLKRLFSWCAPALASVVTYFAFVFLLEGRAR